MIKRYNIFNHSMARILYEVREDSNGEWVKWDDIKHLMPIHEALMDYINKESDRLLQGDSTKIPKGIFETLKNGEEAQRKLFDLTKALGIQIIDNNGQKIRDAN
jgi:hypothetical protein